MTLTVRFQLKKVSNITDDELPLVMEYCPEVGDDAAEKMDDQYACTYKYYAKNTKSIKFTNQVTVLYFNGEDILCMKIGIYRTRFDRSACR